MQYIYETYHFKGSFGIYLDRIAERPPLKFMGFPFSVKFMGHGHISEDAHVELGPKARPKAGAPAPGSRVSASLPLCVCYTFELFHAFCMHIYLKSYYQVQKFCLCFQLSRAAQWKSIRYII